MSEFALHRVAHWIAPDPVSKFLLMRAAAYADPQGFFWVLVRLVAAEMGVSERTVQDRRRKLVECGMFEETKRTWRTKSNRLVPIYRLPLEREGFAFDLDDDASSAEVPSVETGAATCTGADPTTGEGSFTHTGAAARTRIRKEGERRESSNELSPRKREVEQAFNTWMGIYPRKVEQRAAFRLFERILVRREATAEELIAGAQRYAIEVHGRDLAMVKNPTTWLQRQCWLAEPSVVVAEAPKVSAVPEFDLPSEVISAVLAAAPDASACLHGATWRAEDRTIVTARQWGTDKLVERVGAFRLRALDLRAEPAGR